MRKFFFTIFSLAIVFAIASAQTVGDVEIKDYGYGQKRFKKAEKKIYIAQFRVVYQLMADWSKTAKGGRQLGGSYRGNATARLALGTKGISEADLQEMTDQLYNDYVGKLEAGGYEIVSPDEAGKIEFYSQWERKTGGKLSLAQYPGYIMSTPSGYDYYVKRTDKKGREKKTFLDDSPKISVGLDGAVVSKVNFVVQFVTEAESAGSKMLGKTLGGIAKVVAKTDFRLDKDGVMGGGAFSTDFAKTQSTFTYAVRKMAPEAQSTYNLKKSVPINGVYEKKKYKAVETAQTDNWGTDYGAMRIFSADNTYFENLQAIEVDATKYKKGLLDATSKFMNASVSDFLGYTK